MTDQPIQPIPVGAKVAEVNGETAAVVDTRDTALALFVTREGDLTIRSDLDPIQTALLLKRIYRGAADRALRWKVEQS